MKRWGTLAEELPELLRQWAARAETAPPVALIHSTDLARHALGQARREQLAECVGELRVYLEQCSDGRGGAKGD